VVLLYAENVQLQCTATKKVLLFAIAIKRLKSIAIPNSILYKNNIAIALAIPKSIGNSINN